MQITDPQGVVLYANPAQARLHGLAVDDLVGRPASLLSPPETRSEVASDPPQEVSERRRESLHLRKDGTTFPVQLTSDMVATAQGEPLAEVTLCEDISDRKRVEVELRHSEGRFRSLFESASDMIHSLSPDGHFEYVNQAWLETLGYSKQEARELHFEEVVAEEDLEAFRLQFDRFLAGEDLEELDTILVSRNGERIAAEGSLSAHQREGVPMALHGIFRNITQRKKVDGLKNDFIAMVSHELRTPLTSIFASLQLLEGGAGGPLPEEAQELVGIADRNSKRLAQLVEDILDVERIESGRLTFHVQPLELMPLVEHVLASSAALAQQNDIRFEVDDRIGSRQVKVDGDRLTQALSNLVSNAIKFSPRGEMVELVVHSVAEQVSVEIRDRGPGVPEDFQEKIFQKFVQVDSPMTRSAEGTGLGLSITRTILARFGAQVRYRDREGGGSNFVVTIPEWG
ncbi:MAG: PAS domain-containing sensor histidine kinase [Deltaproteobacteria bacterium]|nr:PAS domain-containing sensor histidine kinase [Deltaproteobacteria bacterium]